MGVLWFGVLISLSSFHVAVVELDCTTLNVFRRYHRLVMGRGSHTFSLSHVIASRVYRTFLWVLMCQFRNGCHVPATFVETTIADAEVFSL